MSKTIYHNHHIVPKHMGGTDDPSNLIKLTIEEHAEAHRILYEKYGLWQDKLAWQGLSKMIDRQEIISISIKEGAKTGAKKANLKRWGNNCLFKNDPNYIPYWKRKYGYPKDVDGRKIRSKKYWFNDGKKESQFSLEEFPDGWKRGRLKNNLFGRKK